MTEKSENIKNASLESDVQSNEEKSKVLDLQELAEVSGGVTGETPSEWSTVSNYCASEAEQNGAA
ncbi:class III lanthipeptide [Iodobacter fluviatilis]|uniref:Uncharacterized protein n=1 Tax=Iodobacter fluviatilis TaxID=537 RepID=A0A377Q5Z2_9NEIS|nr:class III lanthipeptide [Iodobacter fluviatilis]TCU87012.1 hypothetical protein EV682_105137 [Iodobacter fluviatilis]STQ90343.1 Uncharacterised protein [Iodobacter fluviatilis]